MKAQEVRLGNYYDHNGRVEQVTPSTIEDLWVSERSWVKPIPLTPEWLERLGFVSNPYQDRYELGDIHVQCNKTRGETELWIDEAPHIKHIHQLQNYVHAKTGQELTIKEDKQ